MNLERSILFFWFLISLVTRRQKKSKNQIEFCTLADTRSWHGDTKSPACTLNLVGELSCPLWLELSCPRGWKHEKLFLEMSNCAQHVAGGMRNFFRNVTASLEFERPVLFRSGKWQHKNGKATPENLKCSKTNF